MEYLMLIVGFVLLIKGADFFVDGSSAIARLFKVPSIIIGLTVVALGTSLPEAAVSVSAALNGSNGLAISNVLGSNIMNLLVVLGVSALILPVKAQPVTVKREIPLTIFAAVLLGGLLLLGASFENTPTFTLTRIGGGVLIAVLVGYLVLQISAALRARKNSQGNSETETDEKKLPLWLCIIYVVGGAAAIVFGGDLVVDGASIIAETFGMSDTLIGLTVVAWGTSLPELVTSIVAAGKGESDLALGNVVGSNMFNIVFILGASALISPITVGLTAIIDTAVLVVLSCMVLIFAATGKRISRTEGIVMLLAYAGYFAYILLR
ncbi:MAG: calcium/sodium antiporter [Clostridia bacterium]|nr:calcium/sodium antiporter [Clostridia bacterium]